MKNTIKITLALALFSGFAMADDGNQGTGGRSCDLGADPACRTAAVEEAQAKDLSGEISVGGIVLAVIEDGVLFLLG